MKKITFLAFTALISGAVFSPAYAQISKGGLPVSFQQGLEPIAVPVLSAANPDWEAHLLSESRLSPEESFSRPLMAGLFAAIDLRFPQSGRLETTAAGAKVWRAAIHIADAPSIGLYFEQFRLPKGVRMFLTNDNKQQVLGAFDHTNNDASGKFAVDVVQGDKVWIELDIEPGTNIDDIRLHADRAAVLHRGIEHLHRFAAISQQTLDQYDNQLNGRSSKCNINAICPQGADYADSRKATIQTMTPLGNGVGLCSGTLVNVTGNTAESCKPVILTAAHCESTGSLNDNQFAQTLVRFNFERSTCEDTGVTDGKTMTGVYIRSRANITGSNASTINGDFMVFELRQPIPASYDVVLAGWKRNNTIPQTHTEPQKFIGFHHPAGDNKKLSTAQQISSRSTQGGQNINGSRWNVRYSVGYAAGGSSGSGLFDGDGHLIGIASTGTTWGVPDSCTESSDGGSALPMRSIQYNKLWHAWEYSVDGTADNRRVKPWLDPIGSGVEQMDALSNCVSEVTTTTDTSTSVHNLDNELNTAISLAPNPSFDGMVQVHYNLKRSEYLDITITDINGRVVHTTALTGRSGAEALNLKKVSSGMYFVKVSTKEHSTVKKLMISHR